MQCTPVLTIVLQSLAESFYSEIPKSEQIVPSQFLSTFLSDMRSMKVFTLNQPRWQTWLSLQ